MLRTRPRSLYKLRQGFVVAFSCKGWGVCPSCTGRHLAQTAAHLADHVIPPVPARRWVISVPKRLRGMRADRPIAVAAFTKIFLDEIGRLLCASPSPDPSRRDHRLAAVPGPPRKYVCWLMSSRRQTSGTFMPFPRSRSACRSRPSIGSVLRRCFIREPFQAPHGTRGFSRKNWLRIWGGGHCSALPTARFRPRRLMEPRLGKLKNSAGPTPCRLAACSR